MSPPTTPARSSGAVIACTAMLFAGIAVGTLVGRWTKTPAPSSQPAAQVDLTPILDELRRLNRSTLDAPRSSGSETPALRETATPSSDEISRLTAAVQQLTDVLQKSGPAFQARRSAVADWKGAGFSSLDELFQRLEQDRESGGNGWVNAAVADMKKAHLGWSRDDLFERYGAPTNMAGGELGLSIIYAREKKPGGSESMVFTCADGLVTEVWPSVQ